ncbi:imidazole glycerol phosphate synthase subunit HisH [Massilia sp. NEAU-DD11]|uniref:Imidazole glycerol phosphate synthase subunit HisH n=1 Tax=Massilia cellulosiltytica TaxID=2683234 RepID=A0A7X3K9Q9_9BURK|nr:MULTISPECIES: imidazole glycerol phosphate synthase subunit HisH [Telluria group]KQZ38766.1 imidazole glycerol phosphate synthase subunit HisH [Massilia sp. Root1485]MVW62600.1 imidazole glycerol phosphate synthase subunit HisH [Telluria cellulosilytica]
MISVIDYGVCNLGSMLNMLRKVGAEAELVSTVAALERAGKLVLPGVGAFDNGIGALRERGLADALRKRVLQDKVPLLGVCLGMQMLGRRSEEGGMEGLGLIDAEVRRFQFAPDSRNKVPHMGWNLLAQRRDGPLLRELGARSRFYFCHSYHLVCADPGDVLATADYGGEFVAVLQHDNVYGVQFHPEKSHRFGMALLHNFAEL